MHEGAAVRAEGTEVSRCGCDGQIISHVRGRLFGRPTFEAIHVTGRARPLGSVTAVFEEGRQVDTVDEGRPPLVDRRQSLFDPVPDSVLMGTQDASRIFDTIIINQSISRFTFMRRI
jgi:hypothetical protein